MKGLVRKVALIALPIFAILFLGVSGLRAQSADSEKITKLLEQVREHAVLAEQDAELLESYAHSSLGWQSHANRIERMKDHVNELIGDFNEAKTLRSDGSPWQQETIDHLEPLLQGMANHLSACIEHLNANQQKVNMKPWKDYIRANHDYASKTADLIRDYVDYGEARTKVDTLEKKLEMPSTPGEE